jgi:flagellar hook-associated protein 3 FlgL
MTYGGAMNNIWKNARYLNKLVTQIETGKQIQRPSDDPLISARSLRIRTILSESEQFTRNVQQAMAWMEVSEAAFNSILTGTATQPSIMQELNTLLIQAAQTGTNTLDDQRAILTEIEELYKQMYGVDMNQTYLNRYVFSGFHIDQPPVLKTDMTGRSFVITQTFGMENIEKTLAFHRASPTSMPEDIKINLVKLPYDEVSFTSATPAGAPALGITLADGTAVTIVTITSDDAVAYRPADFDAMGNPVIHHIQDTGELIMTDAVRELMQNAGGLNVTYEKSNVMTGELNPIVYFQSTEITGGVAVNYNTDGQNIQAEISPGAYVTINSHARDVLSAALFADLKHLFEFADSLITSDPRVIEEYFRSPPHSLTDDDLNDSVQKFLSDEQAMFSSAIHDRINNMLKYIMDHAGQAQREHTSLGANMARLEMIGIRLEEEEVAYTELLSDNEDTDLSGTIFRKNGAESAYGFALQAIARTVQLSLADFINR